VQALARCDNVASVRISGLCIDNDDGYWNAVMAPPPESGAAGVGGGCGGYGRGGRLFRNVVDFAAQLEADDVPLFVAGAFAPLRLRSHGYGLNGVMQAVAELSQLLVADLRFGPDACFFARDMLALRRLAKLEELRLSWEGNVRFGAQLLTDDDWQSLARCLPCLREWDVQRNFSRAAAGYLALGQNCRRLQSVKPY
jgi:hypothetical protein